MQCSTSHTRPSRGRRLALRAAAVALALAAFCTFPAAAGEHDDHCPAGSSHLEIDGHVPFTRTTTVLLEGCLFAPDAALFPGPRPAVVLLHGSGGLWKGDDTLKDRWVAWAAELNDRGWVALALDSFTGRDPSGTRSFANIEPPEDFDVAPSYERSRDAHHALRFLQGLPDVQDDAIAVLGASHGGSAVLGALVDAGAAIDALSPFTVEAGDTVCDPDHPAFVGCEVPDPLVPSVAERFACGVAIAPGAGFFQYYGRSGKPEDPAGFYRPYAPVLMVFGEEDEQMLGSNHPPNLTTKALVHGASRFDGDPVEMSFYPGVRHKFTDPSYDDPTIADGAFEATQRRVARAEILDYLELCLEPASDVRVVAGPWITHVRDGNARVHWLTEGSNATGGVRVWYGTDPESLSQSGLLTGSFGRHSMTLRDLAPGSRYYYTVGSADEPLLPVSPARSFVTPPATGSSARFWVTGDTGATTAEGRSDFLLVRNTYLYGLEAYLPAAERSAGAPVDRPTDAWIHLGDSAFDASSDTEVRERLLDLHGELLAKTPLVAARGDRDPKTQFERLLSSGVDSWKFYGSYDHGDIHVVLLDSTADTSEGSPQRNWLAADLAAASDAAWLIAAVHHAPYSDGSADSDTDPDMRRVREDLLPLLEAAGVDLVLGAGSHVYERSKLVDGHYGASSTFSAAEHVVDGSAGSPLAPYVKARRGLVPRSGAVYLTVGSSSVKEQGAGSLAHPTSAVALEELASVWIEIEGDRMDVTVYDEDDHDLVPIDRFAIVKSSAPAVTGRVWADLDGDGLATAGEPGLPGRAVRLLAGGAQVATTVTGADGRYELTGLAPGSVQVEIVPGAGYTASAPGGDSAIDPASGHRSVVLTLAAGEIVPDLDAGWIPAGTGSLGGVAWHDQNVDGLQQSGEPVVPGIVVEAIDPAGTVLGSTTTGATGTYRFDGLLPGEARLRVTAAGWGFTPAVSGSPAIDSDVTDVLDPAGGVGQTPLVPVVAGGVDLDRGIGLVADPVTIALVPTSSPWRHAARTASLGSFEDVAFDDSSWSVGQAPLGFPLDEVHATIPDTGTRGFVFRHVFTVDDPTRVQALHLQLFVDDGAVVFLNGTEVYRTNLPAGAVDASTRPLESFRGWVGTSLPASLLQAGTNVLAVSVHQRNFSTSLGFDLGLEAELMAPCTLREAVLAPAISTFLDVATPDSPQGGDPDIQLDGGGSDEVALLRWDLSGLPSGVEVVHGEIVVEVESGTSRFYRLQRLDRAWSESEATWNDASATESWDSPGAAGATDRGGPVVGVFTADVADGETVIVHLNGDGRALVSDWLDGLRPNHGLVVERLDVTDGADLVSEEGGVGPRLRVVYRVPASCGGG